MNSFIEWFQGLSQHPQLDDRVIDSLSSALDWFFSLSANQQYVILGIFLIVLLLGVAVISLLRRIVLAIKRTYRRKKIPRKIDLHLDRDNGSG